MDDNPTYQIGIAVRKQVMGMLMSSVQWGR